MDSVVEQTDAWLLALVLAAAMSANWAFGWRRGRRWSPESGEDPGIKFTDASVVLLGLLLAFAFSITLGRHEQRRLAVVAESNALGDFYTCATLLKEPHRSRLQDLIREYAQRQLNTPEESLSGADAERATRACLETWARMTDAVDKAVADGTPIALSLTNTLNEVTASRTSRMSAYQERLPWSVVGILFVTAVVPSYLIGEKQGQSKKVHLSGMIGFIVLVTLVTYVTLDLNESHRGLITISQESLRQVIQSMAK